MQEVKERILIKDLIIGGLYKIKARNSHVGIWLKTDNSDPKYEFGFAIPRWKFGTVFLDTEYHWDTCQHHGTASPLELLEQSPPYLTNAARLAYLVQKREEYGTNCG